MHFWKTSAALGLVALGAIGMRAIPKTGGPLATHAPEGTANDFDFIIGSWTFEVDSKNPATPAHYNGHWTGERTGKGTIIEDDFHVYNDSGKVVVSKGRTYQPGETVYLGITYRAFDASTKRWTTAFVQPPAGAWTLGTAWRDGAVMQEAPSDSAKGSRARFYNIGPNHFTWTLDVSRDGGKTWVTDFVHVEATRVGAAAASR